MKHILHIFIIIFSLNIFGMESSNEKSRLLGHVVIDIPGIKNLKSKSPILYKSAQNLIKLNVKTDSDFINLLPPEIWHHIFDFLDIKDKKTLKTILYFLAPRIGVPKNWAKIIAVNISNHAALRATSIDDWEDKINNPCKTWGNLKSYKSYRPEKISTEKLSSAENSRELIKKYLKILNKNFLEKIELYNQALSSNNQKEEFKNLWIIAEFEIAKILYLANVDHENVKPNFSRYSQDSLKKAYLEIQKISLFGNYKLIVSGRLILFCIILTLLPATLLILAIDNDSAWPYIVTGSIYALEILLIYIFLCRRSTFCMKSNADEPFLNITKNWLFKKRNNKSEHKLSTNLICIESEIQNTLKNHDKIKEYQDCILDFLNSQLSENETTEEKNLDKLLIAALGDTKDITIDLKNINLKEEEK